MDQGIYAIFDIVAKTYIGGLYTLIRFAGPPAAVRYFGDMLNADNTQTQQHPADYELHELGTINDTGLKAHPTPEVIITGKAWLAAQDNSPQLVKEA